MLSGTVQTLRTEERKREGAFVPAVRQHPSQFPIRTLTLSVIIPAFNEDRFIRNVLDQVQSVTLPMGISKEIIVVNDGSTDDTGKILQEIPASGSIHVIHHCRNLGKAAAIRSGIRQAEGDVIVIQDADLECSPDDFPKLIAPILRNQTSVVYGSRFKGVVRNMPIINRIANKSANLTANLLFGSSLTDINTCYKMFRREVLHKIALKSNHFTFDTEITAKILRQGYRIVEIPINYFGRPRSEGKKMNWYRALQVYWGILRFRFEACDTWHSRIETLALRFKILWRFQKGRFKQLVTS